MNRIKKIIYFLSPSQRRHALFLGCLMIIGVMLEAVGIGLVVPAISVITQENITENHKILGHIFQFFGNPTHPQVATAAVLFLVVFYLLKNLFLALLAWHQAKFSYGVQKKISQQLFDTYLNQSYSFHLERNSSHLIRNATTECNHLAYTINSSLLIVTESILIICIGILLLVIEPLAALVVMFTLGISAVSFLKLTKSKVMHWGKARQYHEGMRIKHLQQGLGGIKDLLLSGRSANFQNEYQLHNEKTARVSSLQFVMQGLPRLWLEFLAVLGLALLVILMLYQDKSIQDILPLLGLFALAAFRIIPSLNRMVSAIQVIRYGIPIIDTLYEELKLSNICDEDNNNPPIKLSHKIELHDLCFSYNKSNNQALRKVSFTIKKGMSVGFIGESGSGKSTLIDLLMGLLEPCSGSIKVDSIDIFSNLKSWRNQIGYVTQSIYLTDESLKKNIAFGIDDEKVDNLAVLNAVKLSQLNDFISSLPNGLETIVGERGVRLSGGQRQRIAIARALYNDPEILILDEATSALDNQTEAELMSAISNLQGIKTILIVAHRLTTVKNCDYVYKLKNGEIVDQGNSTKFID